MHPASALSRRRRRSQPGGTACLIGLSALLVLSAGLVSAEAAVASRVLRISNERTKTFWAHVKRPVGVRRAPRAKARRRRTLHSVTYHGVREVVLVVGYESDDRVWSLIRHPGHGRQTGWVPSSALSAPRLTRTRVVVSRRERRVRAYRRGRLVMKVPAGVGAPGSPTPSGRYYVRERLRPSTSGGIYGVLAFGLSAYSRFRTDWPGGGQVGLHGTNQPALIPGAISNGCVRLRNADVRRLDRLAGPGTPVLIR